MNYLKSMAKSVYDRVDKVIQDEYIEPIQQIEVYSILNLSNRIKNSKSQRFLKSIRERSYTNRMDSAAFFNNRDSSSNEQQLIHSIDWISLINPERQFKLIGENYSFEIINYRLKELRNNNDLINSYMVSNYSKNLARIQKALVHISSVKTIETTKSKSIALKKKIKMLESLVDRTMKITKLNIKIKNLKNLLKIVEKIPNIKKMTLFELKNIKFEEIDKLKENVSEKYIEIYSSENNLVENKEVINGQTTQSLRCIQDLQFYVDKMGSEQLRDVMATITDCLVDRFENGTYERAVKDFVVSKSTIEFQKLLVRLTETEIRDKINESLEINLSKEEDPKKALFQTCSRYISILMNLFKLIKWHRYNLAIIDACEEVQVKIRQRRQSVMSNLSNTSQNSEEKYLVVNLDLEDGIKIHTQQVKNHVCGLMDQCLKEQIEEILFNNDTFKHQEIFELLVLLEKFYLIAFSYSSYIFSETQEVTNEILRRRINKTHEKGLREFCEALTMEEGNQWNRLPVLKTYRHKKIERSISKIKKLNIFKAYVELTGNQHQFLNMLNLQKDQEGKIQFNHTQYNKTHQSSVEEDEEDFYLDLTLYKVPVEKLEKKNYSSLEQTSSTSIPEQDELVKYLDTEVVLCQSSITILNYFDQYLNQYFYNPIRAIRVQILDKMLFYIEYYNYYIFETFLSSGFKVYLLDQQTNIENKYLQSRMRKTYENLYKFLKYFSINKNDLNRWKKGSKKEASEESRRKMSMENAKLRLRGFSLIKWDVQASKIEVENSIKARAMSSESIKFVLAYFEYIVSTLIKLKTCKNSDENKSLTFYLQRIQKFKKIQLQLSEILLTDNVPKTIKIDFIDPIFKKIKWYQLESSKEIIDYQSLIQKNVEEIHDKMKGMSKGEIPQEIIDRLFGLYWRTLLTYMTKIFLNEHIVAKQRGGRTAKMAFQKLVDMLYEEIVEFLLERRKSLKDLKESNQSNLSPNSTEGNCELYSNIKGSYIKIKNIFPIILESDWGQCKAMVQKSLDNHDFIYKIAMSIVIASESCSKLSNDEIEERQNEIDYFIETKLLKHGD